MLFKSECKKKLKFVMVIFQNLQNFIKNVVNFKISLEFFKFLEIFKYFLVHFGIGLIILEFSKNQ